MFALTYYGKKILWKNFEFNICLVTFKYDNLWSLKMCITGRI